VDRVINLNPDRETLARRLSLITGKSFHSRDLIPAIRQGRRSILFQVADRYAVKACFGDYHNEKQALLLFSNCSFAPKVLGFDDEAQAIFLEWIPHLALDEQISSEANALKPASIYRALLQLLIEFYDHVAWDGDWKLESLFWNGEALLKVDYGKVEAGPKVYRAAETRRPHLQKKYLTFQESQVGILDWEIFSEEFKVEDLRLLQSLA
jgi:hypothetical protein